MTLTGYLASRPISLRSECAIGYDASDHPEFGLNELRSGQTMVVNRNSVAMGLDESGTEYLVRAHQPRLEAVDADGDGIFDAFGRPCEPSRTNQWTRSQDLSDGVWAKTNITVATDVTKGPDALTLAYKVKETSASGNHHVSRATGGTPTNDLKSSYSFSVKAAERSWIWITTISKANTQRASYINLTTGVLGATHDTGNKIRIRPRRDGWWRIEVSVDIESGGTSPSCNVGSATGNGAANFAGTTGSGFYLTDLQCETDGAFATSFIPTTSATVTRSHDRWTGTCDWTGGGLPNDISIYGKFPRPAWMDSAGNSGDRGYLIDLGLGTTHLGIYAEVDTQRLIAFWEQTSTVAAPAATVPADSVIEVCANWINLRTNPQVRIDIGAGPSSYSSIGFGALSLNSATFSIGDRDSFNVPLGGVVLSCRTVPSLRTLAEMRSTR